jgi:cytochrome c2
VTGTEAITTTESVTGTETVTETEAPTGARPLIPTREVTGTEEIGTGDEITGTESITESTEITETGALTETEEAEAEEAETEEAETEEADVAAGEEITSTTEITESETLTETEATEAATEEAATEEEAPAEEAAVDPALEGLPEEMIAAMANADAARGQQLTLTNACIGCHNTDPSMPMVGPTWHNMGTTAETRVEGMSSGLYLYNSIIHPNDHVVEGYQPNIMLQIYGTLPNQDLADIIAYLLSLQEQP